MIAEEEFNRAIRHAINGLTGIEEHAIRARQKDGIVPADEPYATVGLLLDDTLGQPYLGYTDLYPVVTSYKTISYSLNFHRLGAYDRARTVSGGLLREDIKAIFANVGLAMKVPGIIRDVSEPNPPGWEERAQFDLDFDYVQTVGGPDELGATPTAAILSYSIDMLFNDNTKLPITCGVLN